MPTPPVDTDLCCFDWDGYFWIELGLKQKLDKEETEQPTSETQERKA